jgi:hypothetical protein
MAPVIAPGGKATRWAIGGWARRRCGWIAPKPAARGPCAPGRGARRQALALDPAERSASG